jgi:hypothetical protein
LLLTACPEAVLTATCPEVALEGTVVAMLVPVADVTSAKFTLNLVLSLEGISKFVPEIVTALPATPMVGENPEIVGAPVEAVTVKLELVVNVPAGVVTLIVPVVAPEGTLVTI